MRQRAVVYREHTLGLLTEFAGSPAISVLYSPGRHIHDGFITSLDSGDYRHATLGDFDRIGVLYNKDYLID